MAIYSVAKSGNDIPRDIEAFFAEVADDDLLKFLSQLPMVWGNDEAEKRLEKETGRTRRVGRVTNFASFMHSYMQGELQS